VKWAVRGAVVSVVATYPTAAVCALLFRFPVPLGGYATGLSGAALSPFAVTIYGILLGGFVLQAALGALGGFVAGRVAQGEPRRAWRLTFLSGLGAAVPGVIVLSVLDRIIGPW
jgi:hypothetical protein